MIYPKNLVIAKIYIIIKMLICKLINFNSFHKVYFEKNSVKLSEKTYNCDVGTFHRIIEYWFFDI